MALIVETGAGLPNANGYVLKAEFEAYWAERAITLPDGDEDGAIIRASQWLDNTYRPRFQGYRRNLRLQSMEWPRVGVTDRSGVYVDFTTLPAEIKQAVCEAAIRDLTEPGSLAPDLDRGGQIKGLAAGTARIDYALGAPVQTTFQIIDGILSSLLGDVNPYFSVAVRA
jgi:hypothetical protein